jgi:hypothetical protein
MADLQGLWNSLTAHLVAAFYVIQVHGRQAIAWLAPPVKAAIAWIDGYLQAAIAWAGPALRHATDAVRPYGTIALDFLMAHWREFAIPTVAAIAIIALFVWMRRRRRVKATLVGVSLDRDPKTEWLKLDIVMRNFQSHALVVHSLHVEQPADARICAHWQAWQPSADGVKFIAPELALTNEAEIERTILPHGARGNYHDVSARKGDDGADDKLIRSFYLRAPAVAASQPIKVRAVLHCELQTRHGRKQDHAFQSRLDAASPGKVEAVAG